MLSLSVFPLPIRFLSSASLPVPATQPLFLPFRSSRPRLTAASPVRPSAFRLPGFSTSVPPGFPCFPSVFSTQLSVCFLSSLPASLPQLFHRCFPLAFAFGLFPCSNFLSSVFRSVLTTQPSALSFPFFPFSPGGGSHGAYFLFRPACCHAVLPIPVLSFLQFLSPSAVSLHRSYHSAPTLAVDFPWLTL